MKLKNDACVLDGSRQTRVVFLLKVRVAWFIFSQVLMNI